MIIALGSDHRGWHVIQDVAQILESRGVAVERLAVGDGSIVDYPDTAYPVAEAVASGRCTLGVHACGLGIGSCVVANKLSGVRAAVVSDTLTAEIARRHVDANVLCLAADMTGPGRVESIISTFLEGKFEAGRHRRRLDKLAAIEGVGLSSESVQATSGATDA